MSKEESAMKEVIGDVEQEKGPFSKAWQNSDAVLVVEEKELHVHSMILSLASPYFDKMFNGSFKESQTKRVTLEGKSYESVEQMITIIYPNMNTKFEFKTKLCDVCYPEAGNRRVKSCEDCTQAKGINSLCKSCIRPGTELCPKCKKYFTKSNAGRTQHFESLRSLFKLSEEYMVPTLSSIVENEVLSMSKSLKGSPNHYIIELLELADALKYQESIDLCVQYLVSKISRYDSYPSLRDLLKDKKVSSTSKNKLIGMMMQKQLGEAEKGLKEVDDEMDKMYKEKEEYKWRSRYSTPNTSDVSSDLYNAMKDLKVMAKDLTA